jgi:ATP-binding cassette subfamily B protein
MAATSVVRSSSATIFQAVGRPRSSAASPRTAEAEFYDRFFELTEGSTALVVSHRFASVRRANLICVVDGGRVVELGSHDELLERQGQYATMFALQSAKFGHSTAGERP